MTHQWEPPGDFESQGVRAVYRTVEELQRDLIVRALDALSYAIGFIEGKIGEGAPPPILYNACRALMVEGLGVVDQEADAPPDPSVNP